MMNTISHAGRKRAGIAAVVTMVALAAYGIGQTRAHDAIVSAAEPQVTLAGPVSGPTSYAEVVDVVTPAVVTVRVEKQATAVPAAAFPDDPLFRQFFGRDFQLPQREMPMPRQNGLGSGVITTSDGYILTNNHVVDGADRVRVELSDQRTFDAKVIGADQASDLAVLKVEADNLPTMSIGDSSAVRVGDVVLAVGNPLGVGQTVTMGIISAKGRATGVGDGSYEDFLQTDAPINQGNSGGALVNLRGQLIGINSQILTPSGGNIGLGFAIPSNMAREVMDQLKTTGTVRRGRLGVGIQGVTADMAESLGLPNASGAIVSSVEPGSAAALAGLKQGDVITAVDGESVANSNALRNRIAGTLPGTSVTLDVMRDGRSRTMTAKLDSLEPAQERADRGNAGSSERHEGAAGMRVEPLTPDLARNLGVEATHGLVVREVEPDGPAALAGLQPGDVITQANGKAIEAPGELRSALESAGQRPVLLLVTRDQSTIFLTIRPRS